VPLFFLQAKHCQVENIHNSMLCWYDKNTVRRFCFRFLPENCLTDFLYGFPSSSENCWYSTYCLIMGHEHFLPHPLPSSYDIWFDLSS
jgi:hypothetical protein